MSKSILNGTTNFALCNCLTKNAPLIFILTKWLFSQFSLFFFVFFFAAYVWQFACPVRAAGGGGGERKGNFVCAPPPPPPLLTSFSHSLAPSLFPPGGRKKRCVRVCEPKFVPVTPKVPSLPPPPIVQLRKKEPKTPRTPPPKKKQFSRKITSETSRFVSKQNPKKAYCSID